jgi:hypothetical protein
MKAKIEEMIKNLELTRTAAENNHVRTMIELDTEIRTLKMIGEMMPPEIPSTLPKMKKEVLKPQRRSRYKPLDTNVRGEGSRRLIHVLSLCEKEQADGKKLGKMMSQTYHRRYTIKDVGMIYARLCRSNPGLVVRVNEKKAGIPAVYALGK